MSSTEKKFTEENYIPFLEEELTTSKDDHKKCQMIYFNLIRMLDGKENITPTHIIRELWQTKRCDNSHYDMADVRTRTKTYIEKLSSGSFQNMFTIGKLHDEATQDVADSTVIHYNSWYRDNLIDALSYRNKLYYYFWYKAEVAVASWTILGGGIYGGKVLFQKYGPSVSSLIKKQMNKK